ncbi:RNA-directed DNA polymerase, eukaryota, partial [Tanacetum coccineum]
YGSVFNAREANAFNKFIATNGLLDFQMGGRQFTRFSRSGDKMSKLDRFLVSHNFSHHWPDTTVTAMCRFISDHSPVILKECHRDFGPRPFRVFDFWYECDGFDDLVNASWCTGSYNGSDDIKLKNKIKNLKADIKRWSFEKRLKDTAKLENLKSVLLNWDSKAERGLLCASDVGKRDEVIAEIHQLEQEQRNALKQKSRIKWAIEGDENTSWFQDALGLKVNLSKSRLYGIGVDINEVINVANSINCQRDSIPFCYLGLPVGKNLRNKESWLGVMDRVKSRCDKWNFMVKWDSVLQSSETGGLDIGSLKAKNLGLLGKWWWRFLNEKNALWCRVISVFYGVDGGFSSRISSVEANLHFGMIFGRIQEWCSSPRGRTLDEVSELSRLIGNLVLTSKKQDGWRWKLNPNGKFTVNNLSKLINIAILGFNVMSYKVD